MSSENASPIPQPPRIPFARGIVFVVSFCLMVVELAASRIIAPYLGVSLFTWTGVIAMILLGFTLGNVWGGRLADKSSSVRLLGGLIIAGGACALLPLFAASVLGTWLAAWSAPLWLSVTLFCLGIFFPAAFFLSTVSPQILKLCLQDLTTTGSIVGSIGAWNAFGSIAGTYLAGFIFLQYFRTQTILLSLMIVLILLGLVLALIPSRAKERSK